MEGTPSHGGYPVPCPWVPHPMSRGWGYPISCPGGFPGVPPGPEMEYPPTRPGMGYSTPLDHGWGTPWPDLGWVTPRARPGMGYPPHPDLGWGTPPLPSRPGWGTPPRNVNRQTPVKTVPSRHTTYAGGKKMHGRQKCPDFITPDKFLFSGSVTETYIECFNASLTLHTTLSSYLHASQKGD